MSRTITLDVLWTNGAKVVVQIPEIAPVKDVVELCYTDKTLFYYPFLIHKGRLLDLTLSLKFQNVENGDSLVVYEHRAMNRPPPKLEITNLDSKIYSVMLEALSLNDRFYHNIEMNQKTAILYQKLVPAATMTIENDLEYDPPTVIPQKKKEPSIKALPPLIEKIDEYHEDEVNDENVPLFATIEEAGKYFAKHSIDWTW
ncbi:hypothetical protein TRFO_04420 [Tritrichomonas foetus]|uniref:Ubiquitin-like domain-containing protein n=1 Tax=Tritrichomonas foetus TaxID=1144522 RepID=A0A1J4KEL6_9EUKA|nr:hypothetical protein TRFO_04420 [Tritrichomonas foetus]|eukprot:OHT09881.1 hypothetical protein TRFO_04420 [Tritrichomonas foetus]